MEPPPAAAGASLLKAYLQLCRLPNVFTALGDVLMGWFFVATALVDIALVALLAASACLYTAGMVLNDAFDAEVDARERPRRPIPSGRVSLARARGLGWGLLIVSVVCGWTATTLVGHLGPGLVATLLAAMVVGYDAWLKRTPLGPAAMGACRMLNVLLGMSAATAAWQSAHYAVAAGLGVYVAGFTLFARKEATESDRPTLLLALAIMLAGVGLIAALPFLLPPGPPAALEREPWWLLLVIVVGPPVARCIGAIKEPDARRVQGAVKRAILSLIFLDAAVCVLVRGVEPALVIVALVVPTLFAGRYIYST